jgi:indolepyruvate ferredoxin oxidoreductase
MVTHPGMELPTPETLTGRLAAAARPDHARFADAAAITTDLFGDAVTANFFVVGMAVQGGSLPIRAESIERAIALNGVAVEANRAAFRWGRLQVAQPDTVAEARAAARPVREAPPPLPEALDARVRALARADAELMATLRLRTADLVAYQDRAYAEAYLATLEEVAGAETAVAPGSTRLTDAAARSLHKLLAYKDEYEVARLLLEEEGRAPARRLAEEGGRVTWLLHPPLLRALGLGRKLAFPSWTAPLFRLLARGRVLRGTWLDPFGRTRVRRVERELPDEFRAALCNVLAALKPERLDDAVALARLPLSIRGYEDLKLARVHEYRTRLAEQLERFRD